MSDGEEESELYELNDVPEEVEGEGEEEIPVPLWSNLKLPQQPFSWLASASHQIRHRPLCTVPLPHWLSAAGGKRRKEDDVPTYRVPVVQQTALVYDAFAALSIVTVPSEAPEAQNLLNAEKAELLAAIGKGEPPDPAAAAAIPRRYAITVLIPHAASCDDRERLLDCMAFLSRAKAACGPAIRETRMAILANQDALFYAEHTCRKVMQTRGATLVLTWATEEGENGKRKCEYVPLNPGKRSLVVYKFLTTAIAQAFAKAELPLPAALGHCSDLDSSTIDGAYKKGMQEVNDQFFGELSAQSNPPELDYKLSFGPDGHVDYRVFLRIAPVDITIDHPDASIGLLLYREGKEKELYDYAVGAMQEERAKQPGAPIDSPFGLRAPVTTKEQAAEPWVLVLKHGYASFRDRVSCYGLKGAPGYKVSGYDNAVMPKLIFELHRYDEWFTSKKWVFPCMQDMTEALNGTYKEEQCEMTKEAIRAFGKVLGLSEGARRSPPSPIPPQNSVFKIKVSRFKPCEESLAVARMSGISLDGAFRLGEVLERVEGTKQTMLVMRAFLTKSIARLGRNAPMVEALTRSNKLEEAHEDETKELHQQVRALQDQVRDMEVAAKRAALARPTVAPCSLGAMANCLEGMNVYATYGLRIIPPMSKNKAHGIANVLTKARGVVLDSAAAVEMASAHWEACREMSIICTAAHMGTAVYRCPIYIVVALEDGERAECLKAKTSISGAFSVFERVSPMEMYDAPKKHDAVLLLQYFEADKKLYAFVPCE